MLFLPDGGLSAGHGGDPVTRAAATSAGPLPYTATRRLLNPRTEGAIDGRTGRRGPSPAARRVTHAEAVHMKKMVLIPVVVVVAVAAVAITIRMRERNGDGLEVQTEPVTRRQIIETVTATGAIQPVTQVNISADVSAKIISLAVDEGEWVDKGQLLLGLDRERYVAALDSAKAMLSAAEADANLARENMVKVEKDLERTAQLFARSLESQASLDAAYATAQVEKARHDAPRSRASSGRGRQ